MKVVHSVLAHPRSLRINNDAALFEGRSIHAALHTFDQINIFALQYVIDVCNRLPLLRTWFADSK